MMKKLDKVPIHNLAEEHSVGLVNYGIRIRGKYTITTVSQNVRKLADIEFLKKNKILLALSPDLMKYLITWAVITMMLSGISGCTLKSD